MGVHVLFLRILWLCCDVDHSPAHDTEVKNGWNCTSTPPISVHGMDRGNLSLNEDNTL